MNSYVALAVSRSPIVHKKAVTSRIAEIFSDYGVRSEEGIDPVFLSQLIARAVGVRGQGEVESLATIEKAPENVVSSPGPVADVGEAFDMEKRREELSKLNMDSLRALGARAAKKADLVSAVLEIERKRSSLIPVLLVKGGMQREAFWKMSEFDYAAYADDVRKAELRGRPAIEEGAFTCKRCKSQRTVMRSKYGASGDEAVPVIVICLGCGNTW